MGDLFSCHVISNPGRVSEASMLKVRLLLLCTNFPSSIAVC
jgi:hypothetical protein